MAGEIMSYLRVRYFVVTLRAGCVPHTPVIAVLQGKGDRGIAKADY